MTLKDQLAGINQSHALRFADQLDGAGRAKLEGQLTALDLAALPKLIEEYVKNRPHVALPTNIEPAKAYPQTPGTADEKALYEKSESRGAELLKAGKIAAFLVAGGQGTRLGYDGPKGEYKVTPIKHKPLFQVFAEQLLAHSRDADKPIPWYILTSDINDGPTKAFFEQNNHFGLNPADIVFVQQGMMPAFSTTGDLLLGAKDSLALSPDGHGGSLRALRNSGALADMRKRGVEHLSYFQVDNPLIHIVDTTFLGLHDLTGSEMSSKTIGKAHALEKVGNFCVADGVLQVIEYSDLPDHLAKETNADGTLKFNAGSIAIHALRVSFIDRLTSGQGTELPWHRADKKVPYVDDKGTVVKPDSINAVKLEQFVFDAIPLAKNPIVMLTDRAEEFSPVKNAQGHDSPATCRRDQLRRSARWLKAAGVTVATKDGEPDAVIEISPLFAATADQLKKRPLPKEIKAGDNVYLA